jgi:phosphoribosylaminoimidazole-succinocarboxamide synthase
VRHIYSGKVRDLYELPDGRLLVVASDRISAYDHVLPSEIPDKGRVLTQLSLWWFEQLTDLVPNHVLSVDVPREFAGRALICEPLDMLPVECVARGYLAGSARAEYASTRSICGVALPDGLSEGSRLPDPVFTPATKAALGEHDENVTFDAVENSLGAYLAHELRRVTLEVYRRGHEIAASRGIVLADTKLEFAGAVTAQWCSPTRCSLRIPRGSGRPTRGRPVTSAVVRQAVRTRLAHLARVRLG